MDATDYRILLGLFADSFASNESLARKVGITRNAVARRLRNLRRDGIIGEHFAVPNPALFGRRLLVVLHKSSGRPPGPQVLEHDGVAWYSLNFDGRLAVGVLNRPDEGAPKSLERVVGAPAEAAYQQHFPRLEHPVLSSLEWKVLAALVAAPEASLAALARATGLTARTAGKHRRNLVAKGYVVITPAVLEAHAHPLILYDLWVQGRVRPEDVAACHEACNQIDAVDEPPGRLYLCTARSLSVCLEALERTRALKGVQDVQLILTRHAGIARERLVAMCRERIQNGRASSGPGPRKA